MKIHDLVYITGFVYTLTTVILFTAMLFTMIQRPDYTITINFDYFGEAKTEFIFFNLMVFPTVYYWYHSLKHDKPRQEG